MTDTITYIDVANAVNETREATATEQAFIDAQKLEFENNLYPTEMNVLRRKRNKLLSESDWTQMPDTSLSEEQKTQWQTYRQSLRDLTNGITTYEQARDIEYPEKPTE
tara:strand:- start:1812 stop:2135 length:324 start_codon:yes stop_codon:yes gene_type:complete